MNPLVPPVSDVDETVWVHGHAGGAAQFPIPFARLSEGSQVYPVGGELLNPVIAPIGYVDVGVSINGDSPGEVELTGPLPNSPHSAMDLPSLESFWTRLLCWSTM